MYKIIPQMLRTYINGREIADIFLQKGSKEMANYSKTGEVHQFSSTLNTNALHFSIDPTQYEADQKTHGSRVQNLRNQSNLSLNSLSVIYYRF